MKRSFSINEVREADSRCIRAGAPSLVLMERAANALAELVSSELEQLGASDVLFVCGGGNNGGDGFAAARILIEKGLSAAVLCLAEHFSPDCAEMKRRFCGELFQRIPRRNYPLIVDCLLGTGLDRPIEGDAKTLITFINSSGARVIACDLPSGLRENGLKSEPSVRADRTLTIGGLKNALYLADGADLCGEIELAKIGLELRGGVSIWEDEDVNRYFPPRKSHVNKGDFGSAAIFSGINEYPGAPLLAAGACLKAGAGYTKLYASGPLYVQTIGKLPAVVLRNFTGDFREVFSASSLAIGMGAGTGRELYEAIGIALLEYSGVLIIDADGLNALAKFGVELLSRKACRVILTPHIREFSRLSGKSEAEILKDEVEIATEFARKFGVTLVLKNNRTLITDGKETAINLTGSPALSKGGSGDVLTGFLAGTCARGVPPFEAACVSSYLLGRAGEIAAREMGEYSPDATDLIRYLPQAILSLKSK